MIGKYNKSNDGFMNRNLTVRIRQFTAIFISLLLIATPLIAGLGPLNGNGVIGIAKADDSTLEWVSGTGDGKAVAYNPDDGLVYMGTNSPNVKAFYEENGTLKWSKSLSTSNAWGLQYNTEDKHLYIGDTDGNVTKATGSGAIKWQKEVSSSYLLEFAFDGSNNLYVTGYDHVLRLNPSDGSIVWKQAVSYRTRGLTYDPNSGYVFTSNDNGDMEKRDPSDGTVVNSRTAVSNDFKSLTNLNGYIYGTAHSNVDQVYKFDNSLSTIWKKGAGTDPDSIGVSESQNWVITGTDNGERIAFNPDGTIAFSKSTTGWSSDIIVSDSPKNTTFYVSDDSDGEIEKWVSDQETLSAVSGSVVDDSANSIENADVKIEDSNGNIVYDDLTDINGDFSTDLEDGDYTLNITKSGYYPHESTFSVSGSAVDLGNIELQSIPKVNGVVINKSSENGVDNATVTILDNGTTVDQTQTNANGEFGFELDNGTYTLNVSESTYYPYEATINVSGDTDLGNIELEPKEYDLTMRVSPYMNHSQTQEYVVRFNDDTITENVTVTSSNITLITVNQTTQTLNSTDIVNDTGRVNITATYKVDGITVRDSKNVTVAPMTIDYVEVLPPLYGTLSIVTDETIQYLVLVVVAGIAITTITNAFGGIGLMIISLIIGWIMAYIPLGVLLSSLFGGIFIMMNTTMREYRR